MEMDTSQFRAGVSRNCPVKETENIATCKSPYNHRKETVKQNGIIQPQPKITENFPTANLPKYILFMPVPLLIDDILNLNVIQSSKEFRIFGHIFRQVIFYGHTVLEKTRCGTVDSTNDKIYHVDDRTASIAVHFRHKNSERIELLKELNHIKYEVKKLKRNALSNVEPVNIDTLNRILEILKEATKTLKIPNQFVHGRKVTVVGVPFKSKFNDKVRIYATNIVEDGQVNRDYELKFNAYLASTYDGNFLMQ